MKDIISEFKNFSKQNWWLYVILTIVLLLVFYTGKGNIYTISLLVFFNFLANLLVMVAMNNYQKKENSIGAIYHLSGTVVFALIGTYGLIFLDQYQYIMWQITYAFAAIKAISFYKFNKKINFLNPITSLLTNIILLLIFINSFSYELFALIQVIGFSLVTIGLVSVNDRFRYFFSFFGVIFITIGSIIGTYDTYILGDTDGVAFGYSLLTLAMLIFHIKLLKNYLPGKN